MSSAKSFAIVRAFAIATGGLLLSTSIAFAGSFPGSVPKANCGPGDGTESGLQGQTTTEERFSGDSELGYNCNLKVASRVMWEMKMAHSSGWETTNQSPCRATTGGTRRGQGYQEAEAGA